MQENKDMMLDFTHTYSGEWIQKQTTLHYVDCSDIGGTDMYCTQEAERELRGRLDAYPIKGIHFLDSGNYHYMTRLFTQRIREPYNLVLFDNHTDMQLSMLPELMSCGGWAKQVLEEDSNLRHLLLIGPTRHTLEEIQVSRPEKLICISCEELQGAFPNQIDTSIPVYLSIDKDVLSEGYVRTNWDQGKMTLPLLKNMIKIIFQQSKVLGVDICGEFPHPPSWQAAEVRRMNEGVNEELYLFIREMYMCEKKTSIRNHKNDIYLPYTVYDFKKATIEDIKELVRTRILVLRAANKLSHEEDMSQVEKESYEYYKRALMTGEHIAYLVFDNGKFIGTGGVSFYQVMPTYHNPSGRKAYIMNMYTAPEYRRQGIAYKMLDLLVEEARTQGILQIALEATDRGRPLYEKYGFVSMKDEMELGYM